MGLVTDTWKEWRAAILQEAADIETAADALERMPLEPTQGIVALGTVGQTALDEALAQLRIEHVRGVGWLRAQAIALRLDMEHAKWLGDPKRAAALDVVAMTDSGAQRKALDRLPTVTATAVRNRNLHRWRAGDFPRIDRIVAGARLYAAMKERA